MQIGVTRALPLTTNNVADFAIVGGVIMLGYYLLFAAPRHQATVEAPGGETAGGEMPGPVEQPSGQD